MGNKVFFQFQCLLSNERSADGYKKILSLIQKKSSGSFLAVLKQLGSGNESLSFPREGFTLALDFKATNKNIRVARDLTKIVNDLGGSIYLAKDALMNADEFTSQINNESKKVFKNYKKRTCNSEQSIRIKL